MTCKLISLFFVPVHLCRTRHARALTVCLFLVIVPIFLLAELWSRYSPSTWLLAVTAFSVEVIVKVLVSLATYTLFLLDARRQTFWEKLDDYVYYIRVFGNSVEFCFGIFLFLNGAWILLFESGKEEKERETEFQVVIDLFV